MKGHSVIKIANKNGLELLAHPLGATIMGIYVPDKKGRLTNVVLGLEASDYQSENYLKNCVYLGCMVGRYAGRISKEYFIINEKKYPIYNEGGVSLHGGKVGFDKKIWKVEKVIHGESSAIVFSCESKNLEEGYPGNVKVKVRYELTETNELKMMYEASTDQTTHINLTNHSYFNLDGKGSVLKHSLQLASKSYLEVNEQLVPTGEFKRIEGSKFDFNNEKVIGESDFSGLDDTFVLEEEENQIVYSSKKSGIKMTVKTNQPAVVIYAPPKLDHLQFLNGASYGDYPAICFETQKFADTPNNPHFPSTLVTPEELYKSETVFRFSLI